MKNLFYILIFSSLFMASCQKAKESVPAPFLPGDKGSLILEFDAVVGARNLQLNTSTYKNPKGENFTVSKLEYYISNISLKNSQGEVYVVPQDSCYFLVKESDKESQLLKINNVPAGDYTEVSFIVGVDSLRNTMDISRRTGALDVANGMYWSWNSGYIFFKIEGTSPEVPSEKGGKYRYHIGGFGGYQSKTINCIRTVKLPLGNEKATVRKNISPQVHITVDILKFFGQNLSIKERPEVMFSPYAPSIADNFPSMFEAHHVHNDKN